MKRKLVGALVISLIAIGLIAGTVLSNAVHTIEKELNATEGELGDVVHVTLTVTVLDGETVRIVDTLPTGFHYIGNFMVDGVPATPIIDKHDIIYPITKPGEHKIEFDVKVDEAKSWKDTEVCNIVTATWFDEEGNKIETKEDVECFIIHPFEELHKKKANVFTVTQLEKTYVVDPIKGASSAVNFYDYYSASGHTPFMEDLVSKIYLYRDTTSDELSLIMHHSMDNSVSGNMRVNFNLEGVPAGAYTALSDDPSHAWNATRPGGREFDLTLEPEGNWYHGANSDGGVIGGLPTDEAWCITINPDFIAGIIAWEYQTPMGEESIELDMEHPVTICYIDPITIKEKTEVQWAIEIEVTNPFPYTMKDAAIKDRFGAEIEIDEPFPLSITQGTVSYTTQGKSEKVFLTWEIGDLNPGETARLILLVSTDINPAGKQEYTTPGIYELNSGATLKFIDPEQDMQLSAYTDSIYVTVLPAD